MRVDEVFERVLSRGMYDRFDVGRFHRMFCVGGVLARHISVSA